MVGPVSLLLAVALALAPTSVALGSDTKCSDAARAAGLCVDGVVAGDGVNLSGQSTTPGNVDGAGGQGEANHRDEGRGGRAGGSSGGAVRDPNECLLPRGVRCWHGIGRPDDTESPDAGAGSVGTPAVTLSDIATFRPQPGTDHMQPDGWTIAGLDTNFYALAPQQIVAGTLLGRPADVRFTAVGFHWEYGDGSAADRTTPGATWDQLQVAEFDATPTSHVYATDGDYGTRWASEWVGTAWLQVDLGSTQSFNHVQLAWEAAYATGYQVQTSTDGTNWATIYSTAGGDGGFDDLNISGTGRYVRVNATSRATAYGYSLWEFGVYRS